MGILSFPGGFIMTNKEDFLYDVRIAERNIKDGSLSKKEYEKHLKDLPDVEEKGEPLIIEEDEVLVEEELAEEVDQAIEEETE